MTFFPPKIDAARRWLTFLGFAPLWHLFVDLRGSYKETMRHRAWIQPWYRAFPLLLLKFISVAGYRYGRSRDSYRINDNTIIVLGKKGNYVVKADTDQEDRELRMGIMGQPATCNTTSDGHAKMPPIPWSRRPRIAVVCPIYLSDSKNDPIALKRLHGCLLSQQLSPDLIVLVDDGSPGLAISRGERDPSRKEGNSSGTAKQQSFNYLQDDLFRRDSYAFLDSPDSEIPTLVLRLPKNIGPAAARNAGIDHAIAELGHGPANTILFLTDLDCLPPPDWVANGYRAIISRRPELETHYGGSLDPLVVGGITSTASESPSIYSYYHDFYGTLNPRVWTPTSPSVSDIHPLYAPSCNLVIYLGDASSGKQLPRFHKGFREPSMEDVLFCLEAVFQRGCELAFDKHVRMRHVHREGLKETWNTFRKYGRWEPAVNLLFPSYAQGLLGPSKSISSLDKLSCRSEMVDKVQTSITGRV